ncbi:protein-L-isoaspartate O-methyltransferase [Novosphingobium sp. PASSN1]|uniref:protein-L-isoaspartate O-methyltransferase family protein n=1 Tax=Novosphingobium sp. PASSN1 TaxID=2015561 RepID=UPI000BCD8714|nr:protein-L-isoaspartate O-methyltransferase [Novosphingobium sp. PASSN1]OYU36787.1 MAG: protein-L-isoaspartate O-methyltransferase [Novosphingobium sp. PASSN1]
MTVVEERAQVASIETEGARRAMIDSQLRVSGVNDAAILAAFLAVPREDFVPEARRAVAYADRAVALGEGAVLSPALTYGQMLTAAEPTSADTVLVIGNPGGYLAALAGKLAANVTLVAASGDWAKAGEHALVLVDGAIEELPAALAEVIAADGRLVTGVVERGVTRLALGRKVNGALALTVLAEADFAPLAAFAAKPKWSF